MTTVKISDVRPQKHDMVRVKFAGNVVEVQFSKSNVGSPIRKLDKDHGVDMRTGELITYHHHKTRAEDKASVAKSLRRLRDIINANLADPSVALWVTLTYSANMTDAKQLYHDFHAFWKRFSRYSEKHGYSKAEYISAAEPQGRGAWHLHVLFLFPEKAPFIPNADLAEVWGHGFTKTKSLRNIDNPGLYLTAYLGDMELTEAIHAGQLRVGQLTEVESVDDTGARKKKAIVKGARLKLYPPGFNLYRCSRGIKRPEVLKVTEAEAREIVRDFPLTYEKTVAVTDEAGTVRNVINYRTFTKRESEA